MVELGSLEETVPSVPPSVSVTVTLPSTIVGLTVLNLTSAIPDAEPAGVANVAWSQVAVAVFVPSCGLGADA